MATKRHRRSRLLKKEEERNIRKAVFFGTMTVGLALALIFLGIPLLIKAAIFLSDIRGSSTPIEKSDNIAPIPPSLEPIPEATNQNQIEIRGFTEDGAKTEIFINSNKQKEVVAESNGKFIATNISLKEGKNEIYAKSTDLAGNTSQPSKIFTIYFDQTPPELEITDPLADNLSVRNQQVTISGKTEPKISVRVNDRIVIVDSQGSFQTSISLEEGENSVLIKAEDQAGNSTEKKIKLNYQP